MSNIVYSTLEIVLSNMKLRLITLRFPLTTQVV